MGAAALPPRSTADLKRFLQPRAPMYPGASTAQPGLKPRLKPADSLPGDHTFPHARFGWGAEQSLRPHVLAEAS